MVRAGLTFVMAATLAAFAAAKICPEGLHKLEECTAAGCKAYQPPGPPIGPPPTPGMYSCVECVGDSDCPTVSPACSNFQCTASCESSNYKCQSGIRIDRFNNNACPVSPLPWGPRGCTDSVCCGQCNSDSDCKNPKLPACETLEAQAAVCVECVTNAHCAGGKMQCGGNRCVACQDFGCQSCSAPCASGRFECELPCTEDSECLSGEICAMNPGEANFTKSSKRCQRTCNTNKDCKNFNNDVHTCIQIDGRKFCGQCAADSDCPNGQKCIHEKNDFTGEVFDWGKCGSTLISGTHVVV